MKPRPIVKRIGLPLLGLLLALVTLEVGLRVASVFFGGRNAGTGPDGSRVVICLGDSHTYGVHYAQEEAYPGQLQALLDERDPAQWHVVNLGLPGMNSSEIAHRFEPWLRRFEPSVAIVCIGMNNLWNRTDTATVRDSSPLGAWIAELRVTRLLWLLTQPSQAFPERPDLKREVIEGEGIAHRDAGTGELLIRHTGNVRELTSTEAARALLRRDLEHMRTVAERHGTELVLLAYSACPLPNRPPRHIVQNEMSEELATFARDHRLCFIDPRPTFKALIAEEVRRDTYFYTEKDGHPNPKGYTEIARLVCDELVPQ